MCKECLNDPDHDQPCDQTSTFENVVNLLCVIVALLLGLVFWGLLFS